MLQKLQNLAAFSSACQALRAGKSPLLLDGLAAVHKAHFAAALCRVLLVPGDCTAPLERITAETVVTYGLSSRDSLTLSSLAEPVLCVQRQLPRPGGGVVEPQEFPLPELPAPAAELLPLLGLRLLQLPQTSAPFVW